MEPSSTPTPQAVRAELERILDSLPFATAHRGQQFLRYIVDHSLNDANGTLKEYTIAVEVFERNASYDPTVDATVRVEAGRLRSRLREYYAGAGRNDSVVIHIPKGGYRATFTERPAPVASQAGPATPNHIVRWILAAALLTAAVSCIFLFRDFRRPKPAALTRGHIVLAVLPFVNQTGSGDNTYLTDSLTDNLTRQLSGLPDLEVISRDAAERVDPRTAWSDLRIGALLTGKLQRNSDGQFVLDAELSNAKSGAILHSSQYLSDGTNFQPVQSEVVQDVIRGLGIELDSRESTNAQRPVTSSPGAFQSFLRGESAMRQLNADSLNGAVRDFEDALKQDPSFALAYASLADSHTLLALYFEDPTVHMPLARLYAHKALTLDPSIYDAHGTLGMIHLVYDWDLPAAQNELAAANSRDNAIWKLACTVHLLSESGDTRRAEEDLHRMMEFDPRSPQLVSELGCVKYYGGHYDDSIRYYRQAISDDPKSPVAYWGLGRSLTRLGRYPETLETLKAFKTANGFEPPMITAEIGYSQAVSGDRQAALQTLRQLEDESRQTYVDPFFMAIVYLGLNDLDRTYEWLDQAYAKRSPFLISITSDPRWASSRNDSRFQSLWNRMTGGPRMSASATPPEKTER